VSLSTDLNETVPLGAEIRHNKYFELNNDQVQRNVFSVECVRLGLVTTCGNIKCAGPSDCAVYGRSPAGIVGSNPTTSMDVCCVLSGGGLCDELTLVQGSPTDCCVS